MKLSIDEVILNLAEELAIPLLSLEVTFSPGELSPWKISVQMFDDSGPPSACSLGFGSSIFVAIENLKTDIVEVQKKGYFLNPLLKGT